MLKRRPQALICQAQGNLPAIPVQRLRTVPNSRLLRASKACWSSVHQPKVPSTARDPESVSVLTNDIYNVRTNSRSHRIPLTLVDIHLRHEQLPFAYFFKRALNEARLLESLQGILREDFPQTGGRLYQHMSIQCSPNDTVPISFGTINMSFSEWQDQAWGHTHQAGNGHPVLLPIFDTLFPYRPKKNDTHDFTDYPGSLLKIRVTNFECGGTALGINFNHVLGDTASCVDFVSRWSHRYTRRWEKLQQNAKLPRKVSIMKEIKGESQSNDRSQATVSGMMTVDLALLMGLQRNDEQTMQPHASFVPVIEQTYVPRFLQDLWHANCMQQAALSPALNIEPARVEHEYVRLAFPPELVLAMKLLGRSLFAQAVDDNIAFVSTNDMLTAFGWLLKRKLANEPNHAIRMVVNLRGKFDVQENLFGNGITHVTADLATSCVRSAITVAELGLAAMSIRRALVAGLLEVPRGLQESRLGNEFSTISRISSTPSFSTTSWGQFPLWKIQFGCHPLAAFHGHPSHPLPLGRTFASVITPTLDGGFVYEMLVPSDQVMRAQELHQALAKKCLDWDQAHILES